MCDVASRGCPSLSYSTSLPSRNRYPPMISCASGFHTMSCLYGFSHVSNSSRSSSLPVPPPAARNAISRRRPISRTTFGEFCHVTMYISLLLRLVNLSRLSSVSSALSRLRSTGGIMSFMSIVIVFPVRILCLSPIVPTRCASVCCRMSARVLVVRM